MADVLHRECGKDADVAVVDENVTRELAEMQGVLAVLAQIPVHKQVAYIERLRKRAAALAEALAGARTQVMDCPFEGDVEVRTSTPYGVAPKITWVCPLCGYEHEEVD